jgi:DNA-binding transcriptional MerR regulator
MTIKELKELLETFDEDEEIDEYELGRMLNEEAEYHRQRMEELEERSMMYAYQQDIIDMYRYER